MSGEASWVGAVPSPPQGSAETPCARSLTCAADLHHSDCHRNVRNVTEALAKKQCAQMGHEWAIHRAHGADTPFLAHCETCGKRIRMVEES